jgi:aryl-alcohol dehydrogenase-like predicted oxidoreductase
MTFGTEWGWGSPAETARQILDRYLDAGGNFIDTANGYTDGKSEELLGQFLRESGKRDRIVLATKYTFNQVSGDPNGGGNSRKHMMESIEKSLKRLQTDYIDLYWVHAWDLLTPVEEVMSSLNDLVRSGKVRYIGLSDIPAWYAARAQTVAEFRGWEKISALQLEYSLVERNIEREHIPAALHLGMGLCPWSPLAGGLLSGKYQKKDGKTLGQGRLQTVQGSGNPVFEKFNERNWKITDTLIEVAKKIGYSPAQVALNWITHRPGVTSTIIGATKLHQLEDNLRSLEFEIPEGLFNQLEEVSRPELVFPYLFFEPSLQDSIRGGTTIRNEPLMRKAA